jgi:hypothetical protein
MKRYSLLWLIALSVLALSAGPHNEAHSAQSTQSQSFITVEGADLNSRIEAAVRLARSRSEQTRFWVAYSFPIRPRVSITRRALTVWSPPSTGTETRNAAVFLLLASDGSRVERVEVYNLDLQTDYGDNPVYWAGSASSDKSLSFLTQLVGAEKIAGLPPENIPVVGAMEIASESAVTAIALHGDERVPGILESLARNPKRAVARKAVSWLGQIGDYDSFLASLVRSEGEHIEARLEAISWLGRSSQGSAVDEMKNLALESDNPRIGEEIISEIMRHKREYANSVLDEIARNARSVKVRVLAINKLQELRGR